MKRFLGKLTIVILLIAVVAFYWRFYWVFGEGVKAGELNYVVKKGYVFKTYEGKMIQTGLRSKTAGSIQSYEFEFSVADDNIANQLMTNSGKLVELHYKEFLGAIPWRGYSNFVVDSILTIQDPIH
jgi:hypothetical protein